MSLTLDDLLDPCPLDDFVAAYWNRRALYVPGTPDKVAAVGFDLAGFKDAARRARATDTITAVYADREGRFREMFVQGGQVEDLVAAGLSICFGRVDAFHAPLATLVQGARASLGHVGGAHVNAYLSPPDGGFDLHFDSMGVLTVQLLGSKTWRYTPAAGVEAPPRGLHPSDRNDLRNFRQEHPWAAVEVPAADTLVEQTLSPGDVLYLPPGAWHVTAAGGDTHSLSIAVTWSMRDATSLVGELVARLFAGRPEWRANVPLAPDDAGEPALRAFLASRLDELRAALADVDADALLDVWRGAAPVSGGEAELGPDDVLIVPPTLAYALGTDDDGEPAVLLSTIDTTAAMGTDALPFVDALVKRPRFTAAEAMGWKEGGYTWEEVAGAVEGLLASGLLTRA